MKIFSYTFTVLPEAIDLNGHVNNVTYLSWMIEAATKHSESVGFGHAACLEHGGTWVAKSHHIDYHKPAFEGEVLQMETWIDAIGKIMSKRCYRLTHLSNDTLICTGETEWVFVDSKRMRPMRIPINITDAFSQ